MTRPSKFGPGRPQNIISIGGDPDLPPGQPTIDCCDDPEDMPDRASEQTIFVGGQLDYVTTVLADGPDWYYRFEESSGAFLDSSGNAVGATITGSPTYSISGPAPVGGDGVGTTTSDYLTLAYTATSKTAETIEGWFKTSSTGLVYLEQNRGNSVGSNVGVCLQLAIGSTGFGAAAGQVTAFFNETAFWLGKHTTATVNDGNWHHIAATWQGTGGVALNVSQLTIYIDGVSVSTTNDAGNTGTRTAPISGNGSMELFHAAGVTRTADVDADEMAFYSSALDASRIAARFDGGDTGVGWFGGGSQATDGDDATYVEITGTNVIRIDLEAAYEIARIRLLIGSEFSGSKSYTLKGANEADFSDAVTVTTLAWTATGSFTGDEVTDTWTPTDAYQYWELTGDDETRYVYSFELYEAGAQDASSVAADLADHLTDPTDAHDASAVSIVDAGGYFTGTDVEAALQELGAGGGGGSTFADLGWFNVEDYGAVHDGTTDDTVAIQDTIDACKAAGGGTVYFPPGIYQIDGALQDTGSYNSQLEIPTNASAPDYAIRFLGSGPVNPNPDEPNEMGSILRSSWNGTISGNPAIISAGTHDSLTTNRVFVEFEQIEIRAHEDPKLTAIDLTNANAFRWDQLVVSVEWSTPLAVPSTWSVPTHSNAVGVDMPWGFSSQPFDGGGTVFIVGYYTGARPSEQCSADQIVASFCRQAVEFRGQVGTPAFLRHACYIARIETFWCTRSVVFSGDERWVNIGQLDIEHSLTPFTQVYDIDDASNYGRGFIPWHVTDWTTGPVATLTNNGATGLSFFGSYAKHWKLNSVVDIPTGTDPSSNPPNGRRLYADSSTGHLKARTSAGATIDYEDFAPTGADYLVGTAQSGLSAEIVVGTSPGGELGGTWGSPTVDSTHSGSAHTDFIAKAIVDAKGDLIAATGADTVARVAVGTDGYYLKADSGAAAGVSWAASTGGGIGEILISDSPSTPLVFADLLQNEDQTDLLYADP